MGFNRSEVIGVNVQLLESRRAGQFQKKIVPPSNIVNKGGGGRYQGVGAADKVMAACGLNCLPGSRQVNDI
jgi:hypothetical protein